jgi:biotin carboxylase
VADERSVIVVCPQRRDFDAVRAVRLEERFRVGYEGPDLDAVAEFDAAAFLERAAALPADGVIATKDRSALVAALLAERLGVPGPSPQAVVRCQHKPTARAIQREVAPEATPRFAAWDGGPPPFAPPFFVKPVAGRLSQGARRIDDPAELDDLPAEDAYQLGWAEVAALAGFAREEGRGYVAEELIAGDEVTLEGYVHRGRAVVVGITDSVKYPGSNSFERFEYPTRLPAEKRAELAGIATRLAAAIGFDNGFFNVEFTVPEAGTVWIIEMNARIASQFAPLVRAVHGRSTYELLFDVACGDDPDWDAAAEPDGVAVSYVLRVFDDAFVESVPEPGPDVEILAVPGRRLSEQAANDAQSFRLAIVYAAAETRDEAVAAGRRRAQELEFSLRPA